MQWSLLESGAMALRPLSAQQNRKPPEGKGPQGKAAALIKALAAR